MKRLLLGFGLGTALAYGWLRLAGPAPGPTPSSRPWEETDNDPEDAARQDLAHDLAKRTREAETVEADTTATETQPQASDT
jgi:hypothetical protein